MCDEKRFYKNLSSPLKNIRDLAGDGLFTAYHNEPNWHIAHRVSSFSVFKCTISLLMIVYILMPAFGPLAIRNMFPSMYDIAEQLVKKWERFGSDYVIDVPDQLTR